MQVLVAELSAATLTPARGERRCLSWVLALALLATPHGVAAQVRERPSGLNPGKRLTQYVFESWSKDDGPASMRILGVTQTRDGYLWVATYRGLLRFDGVRFTTFDSGNTPAFTSSTVHALEPRAGGGLWIGCADGSILLRSGAGFDRLKDPDAGQTNGIYSMHEDRRGHLWVLTERDGLLRYSWSRGRLHALPLPPSMEDVPVPKPVVVRDSFFEDDEGTLWFASQGRGVYAIRERSLRALTTRDGLLDDFVQAVAGDADGSIWIGSDRGLNWFRDGRVEDLTGVLGLAGTPVTSLVVDGAGSVWIGERGLYRHRTGRTERFDPTDFFPDAVLFEDREGSLWAGSVTGPLTRFRDGILTTTSVEEGLSGREVHSVYEDRAGHLWVGTFEDGLNKIMGEKIAHYSLADGLPSNRVWSIQEASDRDGEIWLGTDSGLVRHAKGSFDVFTTADGLSSDRVRVVYADPDQPGTLWIGTVGAGLNRWRDGAVSRWTTADGLADDDIRWLLKDRSGVLWIGTRNGLNQMHGGELRAVEAGLASTRSRGVLEDAEGTLWIGTRGGGLSRYRDGRFTSYTTANGLPSNDIWAIQEDDSGHLWMSTAEGILKIEKGVFAAYDAGTVQTLRAQTFGGREGMRGGASVGGFPGSWKGADGRLWFTTVKGVVAATPGRSGSRPPPVAIVESISFDGETVVSPAEGVVPAGSRRVALRYTAPRLARPDRLGFRYRLVGYDDEWVDAGGERVASYTRLAPKRYRFEVEAYDTHDGRSGDVAWIPVTVLPLWWQTWWLRGAAAAGILALIGGGARLRTRVVGRRRLALRQRRDELAHLNRTAALGELTATLGHELRQPLGAIRSNAEAARKLLSLGAPDLGEVREILGDVLRDDERATAVIEQIRGLTRRRPFRPERVDVDSIIEGVVLLVRPQAEQRDVLVVLEVDSGLPSAQGDRVQLEQVLLNLVLNALQAMEDAPAPELTLRATTEDRQWVELSVRDTGRGAEGRALDEFFESFFTTKQSGLGMGLAISRSIVEAHGGRIWATENPDRGLTFHFTIPVR